MTRTPAQRIGPWVGAIAVGVLSFLMYSLSNRNYDAGRGDLFYLADAFLHGRTDIARELGPWDVILVNGRVYVPFPPFPAIALMPLVALTGPIVADQWESGINALLAAACVALAWRLMPAMGVFRRQDKLRLFLLFAFSTPLWWVTTRGGVWHTGHLVATALLLLTLHETWGRQRAWLIGLLLGAAFLTRPPIAFVAPVYAVWWAWPALTERGRPIAERIRALPWRRWLGLGVGFLPSVLFFVGYNIARFGSPTESGYALAQLPDWLAALRAQGLFSLVHVPMNLDYLFVHLPMPIATFPFFKPDGLGMSIFLTSPGLLPFVLAPWRKDRRTWLLLGAAIAALIPTLLYYGGGWLQYGYRYFLDSIPFVWALCVLAAADRGRVGRVWWTFIVVGVLVNAVGVYWAYNL
jgi:hypothetical protein